MNLNNWTNKKIKQIYSNILCKLYFILLNNFCYIMIESNEHVFLDQPVIVLHCMGEGTVLHGVLLSTNQLEAFSKLYFSFFFLK